MFGGGLILLVVLAVFALIVFVYISIFLGVMKSNLQKVKEHNENKLKTTTSNSKTVEDTGEEKS